MDGDIHICDFYRDENGICVVCGSEINEKPAINPRRQENNNDNDIIRKKRSRKK